MFISNQNTQKKEWSAKFIFNFFLILYPNYGKTRRKMLKTGIYLTIGQYQIYFYCYTTAMEVFQVIQIFITFFPKITTGCHTLFESTEFSAQKLIMSIDYL